MNPLIGLNNRMTLLSGTEAATYGYNGRGDMISLTENSTTFTPEYDLLHNLKVYKQGATTIASYGYDGDGQRVTKTAGGTTTVYHHDKSGKLLSETDTNGNRIADYVYVNGNMAAKVDNAGAVSYYHVDPAGTPTAITDSAGALVWRAEYLPFGEEQLLVNAKVNDKMFVGKEKDEETGLYYFGARYMQDKNARFVSVDPVGPVDEKTGKVNEKMLFIPQKLNRYAYALNNPYRYVDPDGKEVTEKEVGNIIFKEVRSISGVGIDDARKNVAHAIYNADDKWGEDRMKFASTQTPSLASVPKAENDVYNACQKAATDAYNERAEGKDPTGGAIFFNLRKNNSTGDFNKEQISTQNGPFNNSYPTKTLPASNIYINTYGGQ